MRSLLVLVLLAGVAGWVVVHQLPEGQAEAGDAAPAPSVGRVQEIQSVAFEGHGLPVAALRAVLATRVGDQLDGARLDHDRAALEAALTARGYLAAHVQAAQVSFDASGGAFVTFAVAQGPLFHVRDVKVIGATDKDAGVVTVAKGGVVLEEQLARARDALADRLAARGKKATVTIATHVDEAAAVADVDLLVR